LILAWALQHREDWAGAAECLQRAVDQLPRDDVLRLAGTKRLVECLEALGHDQAVREAAREGLSAFGRFERLPEYGAVLRHWRDVWNGGQDE